MTGRMMWKIWGLLAAVSLLAAARMAARADVKPNALFSDGAVLQQGRRVPVWGTASNGEKVTVTFQDQKVTTTARGGRWMVWLRPLRAGGPFTMTIDGNNTITLNNLLVGEVWICSGQSNMEWPLWASANAQEDIAAANDSQLRFFTVPHATADQPQSDVKSQWQVCEPKTAHDFSAVGYYFGRDLRKALDVPVGLINSSFGGTPAEAWTSRPALEADPMFRGMLDEYAIAKRTYPEAVQAYQQALARYQADAEKFPALKTTLKPPNPPVNPAESPFSPSTLYNGMIAPLIPYAIRGVIWYQGESNAGRAYEYQTLFPTMIQDWRRHWGEGDFPFLFVQLAPFMKIETQPTESAWAELREAQRLTSLRVPRTAMAVITDLGDENDIHPRRKQPVGARLALAALAMVYGQKQTASGPTYDSMQVQGDRIILRFKNVDGGLVAHGDKLTGFTIAGEDRKFVNAEAEIHGDTVIVRSPEVPHPVAVRFGWANYPVVNLYNQAGLPASPFRTDNFPMTTEPHR
ncbi:MAG TPA: sialate O-acetylesterase [Chthonomonadaceae bacterium]|nr:sialate O-acetylesterase [Chthonomonadaceae bacterium]